jgi:hypothetical protein
MPASSFSFADLKAMVRRTLQDTLGVSATYVDLVDTSPQPIKARWHNKQTLVGQLNRDDGYAETIESDNRIVFVPADHPGLTLRKNGRVTFEHLPEQEFILVVREKADGPLEEVWQVVQA